MHSVAKTALNTHFYRSNESQRTYRRWINHAHRGSNTFVPTHAPADQHLRAQSCPSWASSTFVPTQVLLATHKQPKPS
jgi:hypothetical protein